MKHRSRFLVVSFLFFSTVSFLFLAESPQVTAQRSTPTVSSDLLKAATSVCSGKVLPYAGDYSKPKPVHPTIILDTETGQPITYVQGVDKWLATSVSDLEVVACVTHIETELEQCPLVDGRRVVRYSRTARIRVLEARNPSTAYRFDLKASAPPACSRTEVFEPGQDIKKSFGEIDSADFVKGLQPYIEEAVQQARPATSTPANVDNSQVNAAAASVCNGKFVKEAAPFVAMPGLRPLVFVKDSARLTIGPSDWYPKTTSEMVLVACIKESQDQIQRCWYDKDHFINRKVNRSSVDVIEARTGSIIRNYTLRGSEPDPCYSTESFPSGTLERTKTGGVVATSDIIKAVTPLVQP